MEGWLTLIEKRKIWIAEQGSEPLEMPTYECIAGYKAVSKIMAAHYRT